MHTLLTWGFSALVQKHSQFVNTSRLVVTNPTDEPITSGFPSSAQNRNNSGKRISTTLHGSHCLDRCLLRLVLVNNRI